MTPERIKELRALVGGLRNAAEMSHSSDQDDAADALTEALDAVERVRALIDNVEEHHSTDDANPEPCIEIARILAALEGKTDE
jgi:hypothetical protein